MNTLKKYIILSLIAGSCTPFITAANLTSAKGAVETNTIRKVGNSNETVFSYSNLQDEFAMWGTSGKETYDVAIRLISPDMTGCKITGFSVPMFQTENIKDIKVWLSKSLNVSNKLNNPDILSVDASIKDDYVTVRFKDPYEITEEGVYVGYTFTVTATGDQATNKPVALTYGKNPNGFFFHSNRTQLSWVNKSSSLGGLSMIAVELGGEFKNIGANISCPAELNVPASTTGLTVPVTFNNIGSDPIENLTFSYTTGDTPLSYTMIFPEPWDAQFLFDYPLTVELPISLNSGMNYVHVNLSAINGLDNPVSEDHEIAVFCYRDMLKKRPLVEEYTGLWCGWCPKGYIALERMAEENPDFIGVAIHSGDDMQTLASDRFPSDATGLPTAWIDRTTDIDPSFANVKEGWQNASEEFTYTAIEANLDDSASDIIKVNSTVCFERPVVDEYRIFYYLLGSGLKSDSWLQTNYFSGKSVEQYPGMEMFINAEGKVPGLPFNDVLLMYSDPKGVEGSLPQASEIKVGDLLTHEYEFDLNQIKSLRDFDLRPLVKTWSVVVGVVNQTTGEISNAYKVGDRTAVQGISADNMHTVSTEWFDITGRRVSDSTKGLLIKRSIMSDGSSVTEKIIR